jgi:hypothetical protein
LIERICRRRTGADHAVCGRHAASHDTPTQGRESTMPDIDISTETVCFVIAKAHEVFAKVEVDDPDSGSNATDDGMADILEDLAGDLTYEELRQFIDALNEDEQIDLVALAWLGRGDDYTVDDWDELVAEARRAHNDQTASYLLGMPLLADHLEAGLAAHDLHCDEFEIGRM